MVALLRLQIVSTQNIIFLFKVLEAIFKTSHLKFKSLWSFLSIHVSFSKYLLLQLKLLSSFNVLLRHENRPNPSYQWAIFWYWFLLRNRSFALWFLENLKRQFLFTLFEQILPLYFSLLICLSLLQVFINLMEISC